MNKVILIGRLGKEPEVRSLQNGAAVASFSIATSETYKDKTTGQKKEITDWHNIVVWRGLAEVAAKYLHKGDQVCIEGKIRTRSWEKDGAKHYATEIIGDQLIMLNTKPNNESRQESAPPNWAEQNRQEMQEQKQQPSYNDVMDDLPF